MVPGGPIYTQRIDKLQEIHQSFKRVGHTHRTTDVPADVRVRSFALIFWCFEWIAISTMYALEICAHLLIDTEAAPIDGHFRLGNF